MEPSALNIAVTIAGLNDGGREMSILAKLLGDCGKVRFEGITTDGVEFSGKIYIESFNNDRSEIEEELKNVFFIETGKVAKELHVVAFA
jgi:hypothetical protein